MASLASAFPILPGKTELWKHFSQEMVGPRRSEHEASRKRLGVTREVAYLQQTPQGDMAVVYLEAQDMHSPCQAHSPKPSSIGEQVKTPLVNLGAYSRGRGLASL